MSKIVAVVPARSGSKSVKDKNIRILDGKPLLAYAILPAIKSKHIKYVFVSTDSLHYMNIALSYGAWPLCRPKELAEDVPSELVIKNAIKIIEHRIEQEIQIVCTLQCTTPFTTTEDIDDCVDAVIKGADSAMTVCEASEHPQWMFMINGPDYQYLKPFIESDLKGDWGVRQTYEPLYRPTGGVYASKRELIMDQNRIIGDKCAPIIVPKERGIDIDSEFDLRLCELLKKGV